MKKTTNGSKLNTIESTTHGNKFKILALEKRNKELDANKKLRKYQFSHLVQMLILDYLELGKGIDNYGKKADIYAPIIGRDWETTRQYFSKLYDAKNQKNLEIILDYFKKGGFTKQVQLVKKDINRLYKRE
jgi:NADH:ubiquinone oxidoreductase subunit C